MPQITFVDFSGRSRSFAANAGKSIMDIAVRNGVPGIDAECGGSAACGTCAVLIALDWVDKVPAPDAMEREIVDFLTDAHPGTRLACQVILTDALDGITIHTPESQRAVW